MKIKPEDLVRIAQRMKSTRVMREGTERVKIAVHMGSCGIEAGARDIVKAFMRLRDENDVSDAIIVTADCAGNCAEEPMATISIQDGEPVSYAKLTAEKAAEIFKSHIMEGKVVQDYTLDGGPERKE